MVVTISIELEPAQYPMGARKPSTESVLKGLRYLLDDQQVSTESGAYRIRDVRDWKHGVTVPEEAR